VDLLGAVNTYAGDTLESETAGLSRAPTDKTRATYYVMECPL